jgi:Uma2 family endonuclease
MSASLKIPASMDVASFLVWNAPGPEAWQLVDGQPQAMAPTSVIHAALQNEIGKLLALHFENTGRNCVALSTPGVVPRALSATNFRVADVAVTCTPLAPGQAVVTNPVVIVEILSPSNKGETWSNVWTYTSIPSVEEILIVRTDSIGADILRRNPDGAWPDGPMTIKEGDLVLESIGLRVAIADLYKTTYLARPAP